MMKCASDRHPTAKREPDGISVHRVVVAGTSERFGDQSNVGDGTSQPKPVGPTKAREGGNRWLVRHTTLGNVARPLGDQWSALR